MFTPSTTYYYHYYYYSSPCSGQFPFQKLILPKFRRVTYEIPEICIILSWMKGVNFSLKSNAIIKLFKLLFIIKISILSMQYKRNQIFEPIFRPLFLNPNVGRYA